MLWKKHDATCVKMIDFGLSKDFSGTGSMKTMSGSVSLQKTSELVKNFNFFSPITSHQKSSCRTTIRRLIFGQWE